MSHQIVQNSLHAWLLATRPKTLMGAAVPMMIALSKAYADQMAACQPFRWLPAMLCVLFAMLMQVDANYVNDYFDFLRGNDDETRLGPRRACAEGWVTPRAMQWAIIATTVLACLVGLPLVLYGGWEMIGVGLACVCFCFLYTTTLSYWGLGDLLVLLFFGLVPIGITYYILTGVLSYEVLLLALACGCVIDTLLIINNFRDIENDRRSGKRTLIVRLGARRGSVLYLLAGLLGIVLAAIASWYLLLWGVPYVVLHVVTWREMNRIRRGKALNLILGKTSRNMFIFGLLVSCGILFTSLI